MKIPNLYKNTILLSVILYTQLLSIAAFCLLETEWSFEALGLYSIYFHWCFLSSLLLLCVFQKQLNKISEWGRVVTVFCLSLIVFVVVEFVRVQILQLYFVDFIYIRFDSFRRFIAFAILSIMLLRLIDLFAILEKRNVAESEAKMEALQSRINPHFLFNSLNTISELVHNKPEQAEEADNALALLIRVNLETKSISHSLDKELKLCQRYIALETWRLDDKLTIQWNNVIEDPDKWQVPKLMLQPLIENAIVHGRVDDGTVEVIIDVRESNGVLSFKVENKVSSESQKVSLGNGIALQNIQDRLFVLYDDGYKFNVKKSSKNYSVIIQIPKKHVDVGHRPL